MINKYFKNLHDEVNKAHSQKRPNTLMKEIKNINRYEWAKNILQKNKNITWMTQNGFSTSEAIKILIND